MARLILLDRDGVINAESEAFIKDAAEWHALPGALAAIAQLKRRGFQVAVCSNQSGVGRGLMSEAALARIHEKLLAGLAEHGVALDAVRYCPHHPDDGCHCRKPRPGMLLEIMAELGVAASDTVFVGDSLRDLEAAAAAGCRSALVRTGNGTAAEAQAAVMGIVWVGDDLGAFARWAGEHLAC
ncbi:MAG: D-glycero-beta-D-manno-heptose 1,7-bisphosphate 7-phosphatase [Gammaproteobacteria bacterium]|nr:D-glycero-beta-D-manno-heptose 1,7-bisphosphate 7-phosphatase [Gammaproteobacteria bacterium]